MSTSPDPPLSVLDLSPDSVRLLRRGRAPQHARSRPPRPRRSPSSLLAGRAPQRRGSGLLRAGDHDWTGGRGATRSIRVGSGGTMLPNHTPLKVAETFRVLSAPLSGADRPRGSDARRGTDPRTAAALRRSREALSIDDFPERLDELGRVPRRRRGAAGERQRTIRAIPTNVPRPRPVVLGDERGGERALAAKRGLGFAFAHHINPAAVAALRLPRGVRPFPFRPFPPRAVGDRRGRGRVRGDRSRSRGARVVGLALDGALLSGRSAIGRSRARRKLRAPTCSTSTRKSLRIGRRQSTLVGGVARVREELKALVTDCQADEVMVLTHVHSHEARKRSYTLVADALQ